MNDHELSNLAIHCYEEHNPKNQNHNYDRCCLCDFTRHPCETFELAEAILSLLKERE
jgi:hypothetical protein